MISHANEHSTCGLLSALVSSVVFLLKIIEHLLSTLTNWYDAYCYSPLQVFLTPLVAAIPRSVEINGRSYVIFSAYNVSWARTTLVIPISACLKYNYCTMACMFVLLHDFLDHLDGTVAKVHKAVYGLVDDLILGAFVDAFCDKIVNILSLWSILLMADFDQMSNHRCLIYVGACAITMVYEFVLGVVRVQDYFQAHYSRKYGDLELSDSINIAANEEGKLKEKLESLGIGCLTLAQASSTPLETTPGIIGVACLLLSVRLAHASLKYKLKARRSTARECLEKFADRSDCISHDEHDHSGSNTEDNPINLEHVDDSEYFDTPPSCQRHTRNGLQRPVIYTSNSFSVWPQSANRVNKVYTIGCFDLFHYGHIILFQRMRKIGKQIIVGVHDSKSIYQLKGILPIDDTKTRMMNVKKYADIVYSVHGTDPTPYLHLIFDQTETCTSMYVRGDDMPNFPARDLAEGLMPIMFLPYTKSVSSTKIRREIYNASKLGRVRHS